MAIVASKVLEPTRGVSAESSVGSLDTYRVTMGDTAGEPVVLEFIEPGRLVIHDKAMGVDHQVVVGCSVVTPQDQRALGLAISGLLQSRDFLGIQLHHAHGNMSEDQFETAVDRHFDRPQGTPTEVAAAFDAIRRLAGIELDNEVVADIFNQEVSMVRTVIDKLRLLVSSRVTGAQGRDVSKIRPHAA